MPSDYTFEPSGGGVGGGSYLASFSFTGYGGIVLSGYPELSAYLEFSQDINWKNKATAYFEQIVRWNTGPITQYWFRVEGCCRNTGTDNCDIPPFSNDAHCATPNTFVQNILAADVAGVCENLRRNNWVWSICSIQRFSRPFRNALALPGNDVECLETFEHCDIPECFDFCLDLDSFFSVGAEFVLLDVEYSTTGNGHITVYGSGSTRIKLMSFEGYGDVTVGGSPSVSSSSHHFNGYGNITISGSGSCSSSSWHCVGSGGIIVSGESFTHSPSYRFYGYGGITIESTNQTQLILHQIGYGSITTYGSADYPVSVTSTGGITIYGQGLTEIKSYRFSSYGTIVLGGTSLMTSPSWHVQPGGTIVVSGSAEISRNSYLTYGSGGIVISGQSATRSSENGSFWFLPYGQINVSGTGTGAIKSYSFGGYGEIVLAGDPEVEASFIGEYVAAAGMLSFLSEISVTFGENELPVITANVERVSIPCPNCDLLPTILYLRHNLSDSVGFPNFLNANGLEFDDVVILRYSRIKESWVGNLHFEGLSPDGSSMETWRFVFEWQCSDIIGGETLSNPVWKFSMFVLKQQPGVDYETKLLMVFPTSLCPINKLLGFTFSYHTTQDYVKNNFDLAVDVHVFYDNIGLFKSSFWRQNPFINFSLKELPTSTPIENKSLEVLIP